MAVRTASGGKVQWSTTLGGTYVDLQEVRTWSLEITKDSKEYASSTTAGGKRRIAGEEDFTGTITYYVDATSGATRIDTLFQAGDSIFFKLFEDSGEVWTAPAYLENQNLSVDIEGGEIIGGELSFSRDGALVYPT